MRRTTLMQMREILALRRFVITQIREGEEGCHTNEVTPPGFEPIVKKLKTQPGVKNAWATAWAMKNRGVVPKKTTETWSDAARAASAAARAHGYKADAQSSDDTAMTLRHPKGHRMIIAPDGSWNHAAEPGSRSELGTGGRHLASRLALFHGKDQTTTEGGPGSGPRKGGEKGQKGPTRAEHLKAFH